MRIRYSIRNHTKYVCISSQLSISTAINLRLGKINLSLILPFTQLLNPKASFLVKKQTYPQTIEI